MKTARVYIGRAKEKKIIFLMKDCTFSIVFKKIIAIHLPCVVDT
jgi:hypothetical protein